MDKNVMACEESEIEALDDSEMTPREVVALALTLGDIISMEDSQKPLNNNNINGLEENSLHESELENSEASNLINSSHQEHESQRQNIVLEDFCDHNLFSRNLPNGFGERSFCEAESGFAHIGYSGPISVYGSLSVGSDGSTVSANSFAFPILQSEWNSSPVRMVKPEERQVGKEKGWRHYSHLLCCRF